ncbi:MAG TPA: DNA primase [Deltaproteobacteria bacterium]|nr:DNA primase [Deltaproteobacteria bacterium]
MAYIPQEKIDEIRERADIVEVISDYVSLKKTGKNYIGLCPFHHEKTPSLTVSEEKQIFYCFGCGTGGNVFSFLIKHENMSFPETAKHLAGKYGIKIPEEERGKGQGGCPMAADKSQKELMFSINQISCDFFLKNLQADSKGAQTARDYLKKRGVTNDVIREFRIGYAADSWDSFSNFLSHKKYPLEAAEKAGLIIKRKDNGYYDRFRNRLMFPILDIQGRVIGFGGRTLGNDDAKYINSPESDIFKKGEVLYGISYAKSAAAKAGHILIVEGYFDLITLHQYGLKNSAATMGTALTEPHIRKLRNYAGEVYALFDGDEAGKRAAIRSIPLFLDSGTKARIVLIPHGIDPDEILRKHGRELMDRCIKDAKPFMDFLLEETKKRFDTSSSNGKISFLAEMGNYISKIKNSMEKNFYIEKTARVIHVGTDVVISSLQENTQIKINRQKAKEMPSSSEIISTKGTGTRLAEETILKVLLSHPHLYTEKVGEAIDAFRNSPFKEIGGLFKELLDAGKEPEISSMIDTVSDENIKKWLARASVSDNKEIGEEHQRILFDCCKKVITHSIGREEIKALLNKLNEAEKSGDRKMLEAAARELIEKKRSPTE